jgi:P-type Cu2+ transporter
MPATLETSAKHFHRNIPCAHCGLPARASKNQEQVFCCNGCMGAYALIHELGLDDYYALRDGIPNQAIPQASLEIETLLDLEAAGVDVKHLPEGYDCVRLSIDGMHCAACSWLIERMQPTISGLQSARVRLSDHSVELIYHPEQTNVARIADRLSRFGYVLRPWRDDVEVANEITAQERQHWKGIAVAAFLAANAMWVGVALYAGEATGIAAQNEYFLRWVGTILGLLSAVFPGRIFFMTALQSIRSRSPHVDIPVASALLIGSISSTYGAWTANGHVYFDSLASLVLLLRVGRYLQFRSQAIARRSIAKLLNWNVTLVHRLSKDGSTQRIPATQLRREDIVQVGPNELIPADGKVVFGKSQIDTSLLTGETRSIAVGPQSQVIGGTINLTEVLHVKVEAVGSDSRLGKLMALVRDATQYSSPWMNAADRIGKWFAVCVLALACLTWIGWTLVAGIGIGTNRAMALLTIACPCAIALAAPLVITISLGRAARQQIWIRDGSCLERLAKPGILWLDKTGTLTVGHMQVQSWTGSSVFLPAIAAIESNIQHPIATAITSYVDSENEKDSVFETSNLRYQSGYGVSAMVRGRCFVIGSERWLGQQGINLDALQRSQATDHAVAGSTTVLVAVDGAMVGFFSISDVLRQDSADVLRQVTQLGWKVGIISGDCAEVVETVSSRLRDQGVDIAHSLGCQSPEDKASIIKAYQDKDSGPVVMIGDGANDAAALAVADVGISIRGGSDQSLLAAPVYVANEKLSSVVELLKASVQVTRSIRKCFVVSLLYNAITISLAIAGLIHPLIAALFMPLSGLTVLAMAMNCRTFRSEPKRV